MNSEPGRCGCGVRVLRGLSGDNQVHTVDVTPVDAALELTAWFAGRASYTLDLRRGQMVLHPRTTRDIKLKPVGYRADRVLLAHLCKGQVTP